MFTVCDACRQNQASWNLPGGPGGPGDPAEVVARSAVRSPTSTRAGGQDDVSFTNSLKLYYTILYYTILYYTILYYTILYYTILCVQAA